MEAGTSRVKRGMAEMQKGGVIMDVMNAEQAKIAEAAGATAVMALERVPSDIRAAGGVARMADPTIVEEVMKVVSIPVMAKARIGHYVEAKVLESLGVDYIDESEVVPETLMRFATTPSLSGLRERDCAKAIRTTYRSPRKLRTIPFKPNADPGEDSGATAFLHNK